MDWREWHEIIIYILLDRMNNSISHICVFEYYFSLKISRTPQRNGWLQVWSRSVWDKSRSFTQEAWKQSKTTMDMSKDTGAKMKGLLLTSNGTVWVTKGFITAIYWNMPNILNFFFFFSSQWYHLPTPPKEKMRPVGYLWRLLRFQIITLKTGKWKGVT